MSEGALRRLQDGDDVILPLSAEEEAELQEVEGLAIGEIAGRDAIAAVLKDLERDEIKAVLPTAIFVPTEYGDHAIVEKATAQLREVAGKRFGKRVYDLQWVGSPRLWAALNGRYVAELLQRFNYYSPCPGCHLYMHACRIPLARRLGAEWIISGERESHDGRLKINQTDVSLEAFRKVVGGLGVDLSLPVRHTAKGEEIVDLLGGESWLEGERQLKCVFSGNYGLIGGDVAYQPNAQQRFFDEFAGPLVTTVVEAWIDGREIDPLQEAKALLAAAA
ncbi:MAG: hypothetical protein WEB00_11960 [Dehalococcoidia bacterium]